ncbi:MAG: hypothetical protein L3J91_01910, partial [Thermoplasmata archaeon]|nr:hypothetical protein [Thermoplasmata archaeon]
RPFRDRVARSVAACTRRSLLVIARSRDADEPVGELPWPLTAEEVGAIAGEATGLALAFLEDFLDDESPPVRRMRAEFRRSDSGPRRAQRQRIS